jgi:hypothetical protein
VRLGIVSQNAVDRELTGWSPGFSRSFPLKGGTPARQTKVDEDARTRGLDGFEDDPGTPIGRLQEFFSNSGSILHHEPQDRQAPIDGSSRPDLPNRQILSSSPEILSGPSGLGTKGALEFIGDEESWYGS